MRVTTMLPVLLLLALPAAAQMAPAPPKPTDPDVVRAVAVLQPAKASGVQGTVWFEKAAGGVHITGQLTGLTPGTHGFHIHEFGDCSAPDATSAGGHFNPKGEAHGAPADAHRHAGDFGNVEAKADGTAAIDVTVADLALGGPSTIVGRGVVVHAKRDDLKTQPSGDAGDRIACGAIGAAKPSAPAK